MTKHNQIKGLFEKHNIVVPKGKMEQNIINAMFELAEIKVDEQREVMAKHLNLRNVPRPDLTPLDKGWDITGVTDLAP